MHHLELEDGIVGIDSNSKVGLRLIASGGCRILEWLVSDGHVRLRIASLGEINGILRSSVECYSMYCSVYEWPICALLRTHTCKNHPTDPS